MSHDEAGADEGKLNGHRENMSSRSGQRYTLEELVEQITEENRHPEVDFGPPVGREVW